jgi:hypothetical protein
MTTAEKFIHHVCGGCINKVFATKVYYQRIVSTVRSDDVHILIACASVATKLSFMVSPAQARGYMVTDYCCRIAQRYWHDIDPSLVGSWEFRITSHLDDDLYATPPLDASLDLLRSHLSKMFDRSTVDILMVIGQLHLEKLICTDKYVNLFVAWKELPAPCPFNDRTIMFNHRLSLSEKKNQVSKGRKAWYRHSDNLVTLNRNRGIPGQILTDVLVILELSPS